MKIFLYTWPTESSQDLAEALVRMGFDVLKCHIPFSDYENDSFFSEKLEKTFCEQGCGMFMSFDFFPLIAKMAEKLQKRYVSWVYDTPHLTLYSPSVLSEYVSIFLFDKAQYFQMASLKPEGVYHLPLAVNTGRINELLGLRAIWEKEQARTYEYDVSFVGSLYENNHYRKINYLPEYVKGYIQGIIEAQKRVYGYNLISEAFSESILNEVRKYVIMDLDSSYLIDNRELYLDMINVEVTHQEREELLREVAKRYDFRLFTASESEEIPKSVFSGVVSYENEMPKVFRDTKINLNITLRSITSGISLRVFDILGAGGFLLTNYQPEIAEYFLDGEELVMFESKEDMLNKIAYYLEHEEERERIAYNGWLKVQREFSYETQVNKIMDVINFKKSR